jgi:hypothetical protein
VYRSYIISFLVGPGRLGLLPINTRVLISICGTYLRKQTKSRPNPAADRLGTYQELRPLNFISGSSCLTRHSVCGSTQQVYKNNWACFYLWSIVLIFCGQVGLTLNDRLIEAKVINSVYFRSTADMIIAIVIRRTIHHPVDRYDVTKLLNESGIFLTTLLKCVDLLVCFRI